MPGCYTSTTRITTNHYTIPQDMYTCFFLWLCHIIALSHYPFQLGLMSTGFVIRILIAAFSGRSFMLQTSVT